MKLYYIHDFAEEPHDNNLVSDNVTADNFMKVAREKLPIHTSPYNRLWMDNDESPTRLFVDYGSWSHFLMLTGTEKELRGVFGE